jgi:hypothetical protein
LKEFLEKYSPEVGSMLITEWNGIEMRRFEFVKKRAGRRVC